MSSSMGRIINIQHFSIHDGPGMRTTIFFKGCPLACDWCANPDSQGNKFEILHSSTRCVGCKSCIEACQEHLISMTDTIKIVRDGCTFCGACVAVCPGGAMRYSGQDISLVAVLEEIDKEKNFYRHSGGGVTLSGGEPLLQPDFAEAVLKRCRRWGIHTAIETAGHTSYEILERIAHTVDLIYFDVKIINSLSHQKHTKVKNERILDNLKKISRVHPQIIVRTPIVPGINDSDHDLMSLGNFITNETTITQIELLNYHNLGQHKYANLGRSYPLASITPLSKEAFMERAVWFSNAFPTLNVSYHV